MALILRDVEVRGVFDDEVGGWGGLYVMLRARHGFLVDIFMGNQNL